MSFVDSPWGEVAEVDKVVGVTIDFTASAVVTKIGEKPALGLKNLLGTVEDTGSAKKKKQDCHKHSCDWH